MVNDFNSIEESTRIVCMMMRLSSEYDCHICSVLHENKGNGHLRGHLGAEVINKSESVLSVTNNGDTSTVEPAFTRNIPFDSFSFRVNDYGLPGYCDTPARSAKADKMRIAFSSIFSNGGILSYSDLRSKVMETEGIKVSAAQNRISEAVYFNIIVKKEGMYFLSKAITDESNLPF
jgi:hypothetical protein